MYKVFYFKKRILKFKGQSGLVSDKDIMNLFSGLVNLIKRNTELKLEEKFLNKINQLERQLQRFSK